MFKLINGVLTPVFSGRVEARGPVTPAVLDSDRVLSFYWSDVFNCHVSELACGVNVLHSF